MAYNKHILLGRITKIHGFGGAVTVKTEKIFSENILKMESVFLEIDGSPVPFFIEYIEHSTPDVLKMKFEGYDTDTKVREFVNCMVYLTNDPESEKIVDDLQDLLNYTVLSDKNQKIGVIHEVIHNPGQILLNVRSEWGSDILIPLHEDLIQKINKDKKILIMMLPEGLILINQDPLK